MDLISDLIEASRLAVDELETIADGIDVGLIDEFSEAEDVRRAMCQNLADSIKATLNNIEEQKETDDRLERIEKKIDAQATNSEVLHAAVLSAQTETKEGIESIAYSIGRIYGRLSKQEKRRPCPMDKETADQRKADIDQVMRTVSYPEIYDGIDPALAVKIVNADRKAIKEAFGESLSLR